MAHLSGSLANLINLNVQLETQEILIGATEPKDESTDDRARILPTGTAVASGDANALLIAGYDGTSLLALKTTADGTLETSASCAVKSAIIFQTVTIAAKGTPVQGPTVAIPIGATLMVRQRVTQVASAKGRISHTEAGADNDLAATLRLETVKGDSFSFNVDNMDVLWFDADTNGTVFELIAEQ